MRTTFAIMVRVLAFGAISNVFAVDAQSVAYTCPMGMKQVAKVCVTDDQKHAQCLYPAAIGQPPKSGGTQDANPMTCPRHPPGTR
jgi:hypothetical protein